MSLASELAELRDLEAFAMKASYGRLTGVSVACHAISDAYLLMHVGVGCKNKATHLLAHDWEQHANLRQGWTEVGNDELIKGSAQRIGPYLRSWQRRMDSGYVCVVSVTFIELAGEDVRGEVGRIQESSGVPIDLVDALGFDGDEFDGYATVTAAVMRHIDWKSAARRPKQVSLLGYWFDRYEGDHAANFVQLNEMLRGIGAEMGPALFSGRPFRDYHGAAESELLVSLPYLPPGHEASVALRQEAGRQVIDTDLPIGFSATRRWLRDVGAALGLDRARIDAYIARREERAREPLNKMRSRWRSQRVAVFAEPPLAAGLCGALAELGFQPVLIGLRGQSLGGAETFRAALERNELALPADARVLEDPSLATIRRVALESVCAGELHGIVGSATELNQIRSIPAEELQTSRTLGRGPFLLEAGFPCNAYHALRPMPTMGFGGMACLAQRLQDPPRLWGSAAPRRV